MSPSIQMHAGETASASSLPLFTPGDFVFWIYLYPVQFLARFIPPRVLYWMGKLGEPIMQFQMRRRKRKAARWIVASGCASPERAASVARQCVSHQLFQNLDELMLLRPQREGLLRCTGIEGGEYFEQALKAGKGVILLSAHFGANRVATTYLVRKGYPILSVHNQSPANRHGGRLRSALQPRFTELRRRANPDVVYIQDPECGLKILQTLRRGGAVRIQMDGFAGSKYLEWHFLGVPWRVPAGIFEIARVSGCAVVPMMALGRGRAFRIFFGPSLPVDGTGARGEFVSANLPVFLEAVEKQVLNHPEEWILWTHY